MLVTLVVGLYGGLTHMRVSGASAEATIRMGIAAELFGNDSRGYHALINSVMLPPLPTLAGASLAWWRGATGGAGFYLLLALAAAGAAGYLVVLARVLRMPWGVGAVLAAIILLTPWSPLAPWQGSSATGSFLFITAISTHLLAWLRGKQLMSLGLASALLGLALLWDTRLFVMAPLGVALVAGHVRVGSSHRRLARLEGLTLVFVTPLIYLPAVWVLFNWLIFGNPLWLFHDAPSPVLWLALWVALVSTVAGGFAFLFFGRRRVAEALVVGLYGLMTVGLLFLGLVEPSAASAAAVGRSIEGRAQDRDAKALSHYVSRRLSGRLVLVAGKPGYQVRGLLGDDVQVVHRLEMSAIDAILVDTRGREVYVVLSDDQVTRWRGHFGEEFWSRRFLEDARFGRWHVLWCIRPAALEQGE